MMSTSGPMVPSACRTGRRSCWNWFSRPSLSTQTMATTADFRNGLVLDIDGQLFQMVYFQHVKPGKGGAFVRTKLKNIRTGAVIDRTYTAGERVNDVRLERRPIQFSYVDGHFYHFMDQQTFDDIM